MGTATIMSVPIGSERNKAKYKGFCVMSYSEKAAENKKVAEKCVALQAYNAGVTRAYYSAFQHVKAYLISKRFNYNLFLQNKKSADREFSHGTMQAAITSCLMAHGKNPADICKMRVLSNLYHKRKKADYEPDNIIEAELVTSLKDLDTVLTVVA